VTPKQRQEPERRRDEIAAKLLARIGKGEFAVGAEVPSSRELATAYECAPMTALAALQILSDAGVITIRPGRGSIVAQAAQSIAGPTERLHNSRTGSLFRPGETQEILRAQLDVGHLEARAALGVDVGESLGAREYVVRNAAGTVVTYATSFVHPDVWAAVAELREPRPIPDGIIGAVDRVLARRTVEPLRRRVEAAPATEEEAALLGVVPDSPVLVEIVECHDEAGRVVEWNISVHPSRYRIGR